MQVKEREREREREKKKDLMNFGTQQQKRE